MSRLDLKEYQRLLQAKHHELLSRAINRDEIVIETTADEIDMLQQQLSREVAIRNFDHKSKLLKGIQAALDRFEDEMYGVCLRCEEPIPEKRLKAVPWAAYCVGCQEIIDNQRKWGELEEDGEISNFAA